MEFRKGKIEGVVVTSCKKYIDDRGWLAETYRNDDISSPYRPVMSYTSLTLPGVTRGPHEHVDQSDYFVFLGPGNFKIWVWDNRKESSTYLSKMTFYGGVDNPMQILIPPGVVHAYRNVSSEVAMVQNFPNQLFMGEGKRHAIDEIRHEDDPRTPFQCD